MQRAFADASEQRDLCRRLEAMLRDGEAPAALALVRQGLEALADQELAIVDIALATRPEALAISGWDKVAATLAREEAGGKRITMIGIDLTGSCREGIIPAVGDEVPPYLETSYFEDVPEIAFSTASRAQIRAAYADYGAPWAGCFAEIDGAVEIAGLSRLYSAVVNAKAAGHRDREDAEGDAYVLASCAAAILLHLAVRQHIAAHGLPRPMAFLVGSNEDFPYFDAPVVSVDEARALMPSGAQPEPEPEPMPTPAPTGAPAPASRSLFGRLFGR
jgi:hypothetical protein